MSSRNVFLEVSRQSRVLAGTREGVKTLTMQRSCNFYFYFFFPSSSARSRYNIEIFLEMRIF